MEVDANMVRPPLHVQDGCHAAEHRATGEHYVRRRAQSACRETAARWSSRAQ